MKSKGFVKKVGTLAMATMLAAAMAVPAFAVDTEIPAVGTYKGDAGDTPAVVLSPVVGFLNGDQPGATLKFDYTASSATKVWNPKTLSYEDKAGGASGTWTASETGSDKVSLGNRSNTDVTFTLGGRNFENGVTSFSYSGGTKEDLNFESAVGKTEDEVTAARKSFQIHPEGALTEGATGVHIFDLIVRCEAAE